MDELPQLICPNCGERTGLHRAKIENLNSWMVFFGGYWASTMLRERNEHMFVCDRCYYVFHHKPREENRNLLFLALLLFLTSSVAVLINFIKH